MPSIGDKVAAIKQELGLSPTLTTAEAVAAALVDLAIAPETTATACVVFFL